MASIGTEDGFLQFQLTVLGPVSQQGMIEDGPISMNSNMELARLAWVQKVGENFWMNAEVSVFAEQIHNWIEAVERIVQKGENHSTTTFDQTICPHIILNIWRSEWEAQSIPPKKYVDYGFFAGLSSTYLLSQGGEWGSGPGFYMEVEGGQLLAFAKSLREELLRAFPNSKGTAARFGLVKPD